MCGVSLLVYGGGGVLFKVFSIASITSSKEIACMASLDRVLRCVAWMVFSDSSDGL